MNAENQFLIGVCYVYREATFCNGVNIFNKLCITVTENHKVMGPVYRMGARGIVDTKNNNISSQHLGTHAERPSSIHGHTLAKIIPFSGSLLPFLSTLIAPNRELMIGYDGIYGCLKIFNLCTR